MPHPMLATSLTAVKPMAGAWPPGVTFALLCGYAAAALAAGAWALTRRDALPGPGSRPPVVGY